MRLRLFVLALCCLAAIAGASTAAEPTATVVSGTLLGYDGKPLPKAHVHLSRPQHSKPLLSVPVNADGRFRLATNETGLFVLKFTGAHHQSDQTAVFVDAPSPLELDARLGTYAYKDDFSQVAVIGDFNGFKSSKAKPMEKQADGTWALMLEAPNDRVAYQLVGITKDSSPVNGTRSDDFEYDGDDDYRSLVTGAGGKARIVFRPADLVRSSRPAELHFRDPGGHAARFAAVSAEMEGRDRAYAIGVGAHMASGQPYQSFHMDWTRDVASMTKRLDAEKDPLLRQLLALSILSIPSCFGDLEPALARHAVESLSSSSALWALNPRAFWKLTPILHRGGGASEWSDYVSRVIDGQKDPEVVPVLLYWAVVGYREAEDDAAIRRLYDRLRSDYPESRWTSLAKASAPAERTSIGKTVPEFALRSLDDASITFLPVSLKGKITLIDLWATWCGPCVGERGGLHQAWERYHARGLEILSVSFDGDAETVARFRREKWKSPWMNTLAVGGMTGEFAKSFEVTALPKLLLIDRDGKVIATRQQLEGRALGETLARIFGGKE